MRELVIVVSDCYLSQDSPAGELPLDLPGIRHTLRFGTQSPVPQPWRPWLARWLSATPERTGPGVSRGGTPALDQAAPATVAAIALPPAAVESDAPVSSGAAVSGGSVWIATPVHLLAGLTGVHLDRRGLLRLGSEDAMRLASDFERVFHDSGFHLRALESGDFLLFGPDIPLAARPEPERALGWTLGESTVGHSTQSDHAEHRALRRLSSETEMWLHEHPVNEERGRRSEAPVTGLWFWGGGPLPAPQATRTSVTTQSIAFGCDAYVRGLWASAGAKVLPLPHHLTELFSYPHSQRAALVLELGPMLHSNPTWTFYDALSRVDRDFVSPAVEALTVGRLERLVLLANDRQITLRARDRFKLWRRARPGLSGLQ